MPIDCSGPVALTTIIAFTIFAAEIFRLGKTELKKLSSQIPTYCANWRCRANGQGHIRKDGYKRTRNNTTAHAAYRSPSLERAFAPAQDFAGWPFHSNRGHA